MYINKNYHPRELIEAKEILAKALSLYEKVKDDTSSSDIENRILLFLHTEGYRIIKTGNNSV